MDQDHYLKDINEIKQLMNKSSRFLSLSGISGVLAGIYALVAAYWAYPIIYATAFPSKDAYKDIVMYELEMLQIFAVALIVLILSILTGIFFSWRKAKKHGEKLYDSVARRMLINFLIPLGTGGLFALFLIEKESYAYIAPITLIFYGLACINASHYTLGYVRYLGLTILLIGLASVYFLGYGLFFWALGFGVCHIVYGALMHFKYDRK